MSQSFEKNQELIEFAYKELNLKIPKGHEEYERMISGICYDCWDKHLNFGRERAHQLSREYTQIPFQNDDVEAYNKARIGHLKKVLGRVNTATIEAPFTVDYGFNTYIGDNFYANFNLTILDSSIVQIGNDVECGPNVVLCCATHPTDPTERLSAKGEWSREIKIGNKVWLGANVTVLPGVTIGNGCVVGANSVVNKSLPPYSIAVGAPAKVIKKIPGYEDDKRYGI
jgi:acetyltransferase-like isoleucine patch superfamily enzyme